MDICLWIIYKVLLLWNRYTIDWTNPQNMRPQQTEQPATSNDQVRKIYFT